MAKSPMDVANMMGAAAHKKAQKPTNADPDNDGDEDMPQGKPMASKRVAAAKEKEKGKAGKAPLQTAPPMGEKQMKSKLGAS